MEINFLSKKKKNVSSKNNSKSPLKNDNFENILNKKSLNKNDRQLIHQFLSKLPRKLVNNKSGKINLILDLDNTLVYSSVYPKEFKYRFVEDIIFKMIFKDEDLEIIRLYSKVIIVKFRDGLNFFFENTKEFCNYYIYSASDQNYANKVASIIKNKFNIKILKVFTKKEIFDGEYIKSLNVINLKPSNSIILDDEPIYWGKNLSNLILSKKFFSYQMMIILKLKYFEEFGSCNYIYQSKKEQNQLNISVIKLKNNSKNNSIFFPHYVESNGYSEKIQLNYLPEFLQKIHYLYFNYNIDISFGIKILRNDVFYNKCFCVSKELDNYKELIDMILYLGGEIANSKSSKNIIYVEKEVKHKGKNEIIVSEEYIYNCFYMLKCFNQNDEFYQFKQHIIEIIE